MADISQLYIFDWFSDTEISFFLLMSQTKLAHSGERIMGIGDVSNGCAYYVTRGAVRVSNAAKELAILGPGSFFWEIALITDEPRTATIEAIDDTELQVFLKDDFMTLLKRGAHSEEMRSEMLRRIKERVK